MATLSDEVASLSAQMQKLTAAVSNLVLARSLQGTLDLRTLPRNCLISLKLDHFVKDEHQLFDENTSPNCETNRQPIVNRVATIDEEDPKLNKNGEILVFEDVPEPQTDHNDPEDGQGSNAQNMFDEIPLPNSEANLYQRRQLKKITFGTHKVFDEMPEPVIRSNQSRFVSCENNKPITCHFDHDDYKQVDKEQTHGHVKDESQIYGIRSAQNHHLVDYVHGFRGEYDTKYSKETQLLNAHKVLEEMPLPDFIWEMGRSAKVEGDKSGECDHQQHIGCNSAEDEGMPNARHMLDKTCELGNESIPAVTIITHENKVMPTLIKVITKPFLQFTEIDNRFLSPDKIFGNLVLGERLNNTSWSRHFRNNYDLLCVHCIETEYDGDVTIPKWPIWFHFFSLSRLIMLIDSNVYGLQMCLLHTDFDPGGYWCSLVVPSELDDGHKMICLLANTLYSMHYIKVLLFTSRVSEYLDCILFITLGDKGVFKSKEDNIHMRSPCGLHYTIPLWVFSTSHGINLLTYVFNPSGLLCHCALWDDYPYSFRLFVGISLALGVCQGRGDCALAIHSIMCTMKFRGKHLTTTSNIFTIMTISSYISEGNLNGNNGKYIWSLSNILNMYFNGINVRTNNNLLLLTHVFDMIILPRQGSLWSGHPYDSFLSLALSLTMCMCNMRNDIGDIANTFGKLSTFSMVWYMTYIICLNITMELTMSLQHSKFATALKLFANFLFNVPLSAGNVLIFKKQHPLFPANTQDVIVKLLLKYFVYEPLHQGSGIAELIYSGLDGTQVFDPGGPRLRNCFGPKAMNPDWSKCYHYCGSRLSVAWLFGPGCHSNGIMIKFNIATKVIWPFELLTTKYVSKRMATVKGMFDIVNLGIPVLSATMLHMKVQILFLEVPKLRLLWRPGLLLKYSVQYYTFTIFVFDPGGRCMAASWYLAIRLSATMLILEDKDHFKESVMIHTKKYHGGILVIMSLISFSSSH